MCDNENETEQELHIQHQTKQNTKYLRTQEGHSQQSSRQMTMNVAQ